MKKRNDTIHVHVDYRDVPEKWLGKKLIESALEMLAIDERMYKWVWLGKCIGLDEIIYYMFDEVEHVLNRDLTEKEKSSLTSVIAAVDYGQMNATVFEFFGYSLSKQMIYGLDEFAHSGRDTGKQMTPSKYANEFKNMCLKIENEFNKKVRYVYIDPSAKGLAEEIKRVCPWVKIRNAENAVLLGISRTQKVLAFKKIIFSHRQENLLKEIPNYGYDKKSIEAGKEVPVKQDDHSMDALRYMIMGIWVKIRKFLPKTLEILTRKMVVIECDK